MLTRAQVRAFTERFDGDVISPRDSQYDDARRVWNARFDMRPALIARPASPTAIATAIRFARERDLELAVRAGAHSAAGLSTTEGGLVIDLSRMRGVTVDRGARTARANGGALLGELDVAAQAHGLVCPIGVIGHTGVAGLTLGGGVGRLQRHFGLTIDNLRAVELVTAEGELVRASAEEHDDLFWGIRGAGANFGIVTALELDLHPFGPTLNRGMYVYAASQVHDVWAMVRDYGSTAPDTVSMAMWVGHPDPDPTTDEIAAGGVPIVVVAFNHSGDAADVERDTAGLAAGPTPVSVKLSNPTYLDIQTAHDQVYGFGQRACIESAYVSGFRADTLDALVEHATGGPPNASFGITLQGGAIGRVSDDATAFTGRSAPFEISAEGEWDDPNADDAHDGWIRRTVAIAQPEYAGGRYVNGSTDAGPAAVRAVYGDATLARLAALKRAWDPHNVFHRNFNIAP